MTITAIILKLMDVDRTLVGTLIIFFDLRENFENITYVIQKLIKMIVFFLADFLNKSFYKCENKVTFIIYYTQKKKYAKIIIFFRRYINLKYR